MLVSFSGGQGRREGAVVSWEGVLKRRGWGTLNKNECNLGKGLNGCCVVCEPKTWVVGGVGSHLK